VHEIRWDDELIQNTHENSFKCKILIPYFPTLHLTKIFMLYLFVMINAFLQYFGLALFND